MATFYFNAAVDGEWTNLSNWWMDDQHSIPATGLPSSTDDAIVTEVSSNIGPEPTVNNLTVTTYGFYIPITVVGTATFIGDGTLPTLNSILTGNAVFINAENSETINGNATFNSFSLNGGTVNGDATFNNISYNSGSVFGNATFNNNSSNDGTISEDATFNGDSENYYGVVFGDATFNDGSRNGNLQPETPATVLGNAVFNGSSTNTLGGTTKSATFNNSSYNSGIVDGLAIFNHSSFAYPSITGETEYSGDIIFQNRTPYPLKRGVNSCGLLGIE
jgi:hypothetical protein